MVHTFMHVSDASKEATKASSLGNVNHQSFQYGFIVNAANGDHSQQAEMNTASLANAYKSSLARSRITRAASRQLMSKQTLIHVFTTNVFAWLTNVCSPPVTDVCSATDVLHSPNIARVISALMAQ